MVRPRFFPGQLLVDGDLQLAVDYALLKGRLHNRFLHGAGVVCGLMVGCHPCGGGKVTVGPGMALDCCGNDIIVPCPVELDINAMIRELRLSLHPAHDCGDPCDENADPKDPRKNKLSYCLWIKYCEEMTEVIAPYASDDRCSTEVCQASRVREGYSFELRCPDKEDPPDSVWDRIVCCIGDLERADRAAGEANALSYFNDRTELAAHQVRMKAPVPFDASDVDLLRDGTSRLQRFVEQPTRGEAGEAPSEIDVRRGLDDLQYTAAAVVRWDLQPEDRKEELSESLSGVTDVVPAARAAVQGAAPRLASLAATAITSARDRLLARESTAQALRWTSTDVEFAQAEAVPRQYFAYNAWYSTAALATMSDSMTQLRDWLIQAINQRGLFADCKLRDEVLKIQIPQSNANSPETTRTASLPLVSAFMRYLVDCICAALNPPCQPCEETAVKLACLDVENCEVVKICNLERTYVLTGMAFGYWIPFLHQIGELFEHLCCKFAFKLKPPPPETDPIPGWTDRRTVYYQQTAPASRVLEDQPEISMLLRMVRIEPGTAKLAADFGGSMVSMLMNQPALDLQGRLSGLRRFELPRQQAAERAPVEETTELRDRLSALNKEVRELKQRLTRMEKSK
jgi:hypothetical protein